MNIALANLIDERSVAHVEESRAFSAAKQAAGGQQGPTNNDELTAARNSLPAGPAESRAVERIARVGEAQVPVRVTSPRSRCSRATYLDIHGGGFYMDSAARGDARNARLADALGVTVVSVEYRLAPEHPWPAAPDDCETAALWLVQAGRDAFGTDRMLIGGASAGATLATTTLLRLRGRELVHPIVGAALQFGAYDLSGQSPGGNLAMAARLSAAGNEVDLRVFPESMHGFTSHPISMAAAALDQVEAWLAGRLDEQRRPV